ncbi:hypothetical protein [Ornithinimicrobium sp. W1665]|uniref:hypothetical protein n=1 Tax=Ornithinimicrobium sp. W1665 TaxID=3416666 RepID=UPI003D6BB108
MEQRAQPQDRGPTLAGLGEGRLLAEVFAAYADLPDGAVPCAWAPVTTRPC